MNASDRLYFGPDGLFRILQLTDLHYDDTSAVIEANQRTEAALLQFERPDLAVLTGDIVSGYEWAGAGRPRGWYQRLYRLAVEPLVRSATPYAVILGNHDNEADLDVRQIMELDASLGLRANTTMLYIKEDGNKQATSNSTQSRLSWTLQGTTSNQTDYFFPLWNKGKDGLPDTVGAVLVFLYSGQHDCLGLPRWGCVLPAQIEWLEDALMRFLVDVRSTQQEQTIPVAIFIHIPPPQTMQIRNTVPIHGVVGETISCPSFDTGLVDALERLGVITVMYGHDHLNDFSGTLRGITFLYGKKTGYGSYGPSPGVPHGGRVLELTANHFNF